MVFYQSTDDTDVLVHHDVDNMVFYQYTNDTDVLVHHDVDNMVFYQSTDDTDVLVHHDVDNMVFYQSTDDTDVLVHHDVLIWSSISLLTIQMSCRMLVASTYPKQDREVLKNSTNTVVFDSVLILVAKIPIQCI